MNTVHWYLKKINLIYFPLSNCKVYMRCCHHYASNTLLAPALSHDTVPLYGIPFHLFSLPWSSAEMRKVFVCSTTWYKTSSASSSLLLASTSKSSQSDLWPWQSTISSSHLPTRLIYPDSIEMEGLIVYTLNLYAALIVLLHVLLIVSAIVNCHGVWNLWSTNNIKRDQWPAMEIDDRSNAMRKRSSMGSSVEQIPHASLVSTEKLTWVQHYNNALHHDKVHLPMFPFNQICQVGLYAWPCLKTPGGNGCQRREHQSKRIAAGPYAGISKGGLQMYI